MTRKKGGGRESGEQEQGASPDGNTARSRGSGDQERLLGSPVGLAAANPAACHAFFPDFGQCSDEAPICLGCAERIRALEAEVAYRRSYDTGDFSSFQKVLGEWKVRAEKAEARIAELEASR